VGSRLIKEGRSRGRREGKRRRKGGRKRGREEIKKIKKTEILIPI
jgi:hypothetical protein